MLHNEVQSNENLYRAVKRSKPECLDDNKVPTSALFKDANGVSVDRDGEREEKEILLFMINGELYPRVKGIVKLSAGKCFEAGTEIKAAPSKNNPYHANIFLSSDNIFKQSLQALKLARACELVYFDDSKEWT